MMILVDPEVHALIATLAAVAATLYGLAALWATERNVYWLWRWTPIVLLLALLAPIGAYELLALFGMQAIVVIGMQVILVIASAALARLLRRRRAGNSSRTDAMEASRSQARYVPQISLREIFKATVLIAVVLAIVRFAAPSKEGSSGLVMEWWEWFADGVELGAVTLAVTWLVYGTWRWYFRAVPFVLITAGASLFCEMTVQTRANVALGLSISPPLGWAFVGTSGFGLLILVALLFIRAATSAVPTFLRWPARATAFACSLAAFWLLGTVYVAILPTKAPPLVELPNPNGYDEIVRIANALDWTAIPSQDVEAASVEACQQFIEVNQSGLALLRSAITKPSRVPVQFTEAYFSDNVNDLQNRRDLARALAVEAKAVQAAGRTGDALQSHLDIVQLAQTSSRGGLIIDDLIADGVEGIGLHGIAEQMNDLNADNLETLRQALEILADGREPFDVVLERDQLWERVVSNWSGLLERWVENILFDGGGSMHFRNGRQYTAARLRLLLAEAAIRRHILAEGAAPESLAALAPKYLAAVPVDPFGAGPLVYHRTEDGYLLYSVGKNGMDDGGERVSIYEATTEGKGDLFFDASGDMPGDSQQPDEGMDNTGDDEPPMIDGAE